MKSINSKSIFESIIMFILILYMSYTAQICFEQNFSYTIVVFFFLLSVLKNKRLGKPIFTITLIWFIICFLSSILNKGYFGFNKTLGYLIPIYITYFAITYLGIRFWKVLESWLFVLTCISMLFFVAQLIVPNQIASLSSVFGQYIASFYDDRYPGSWYNFFYTYQPSFLDFGYVRNAGFMWEPGAYAMVCVVGLILDTLVNNNSFSYRKTIYLVAIFSTMSTAGYLSAFIYLLIYIFRFKNWALRLISIVVFATICFFAGQLEFMTEKILNFANPEGNMNERLESIEYDRFTIFAINMTRFLSYPLGYGTVPIRDFSNQFFVGVNGIATFFRTWGVIGIIAFFKLTFKSFELLGSDGYKKIIFIIMLIVVFFSNPVERNPILFMFIIYPLVNNKISNERTNH